MQLNGLPIRINSAEPIRRTQIVVIKYLQMRNFAQCCPSGSPGCAVIAFPAFRSARRDPFDPFCAFCAFLRGVPQPVNLRTAPSILSSEINISTAPKNHLNLHLCNVRILALHCMKPSLVYAVTCCACGAPSPSATPPAKGAGKMKFDDLDKTKGLAPEATEIDRQTNLRLGTRVSPRDY